MSLPRCTVKLLIWMLSGRINLSGFATTPREEEFILMVRRKGYLPHIGMFCLEMVTLMMQQLGSRSSLAKKLLPLICQE